MTSVSAGSTLCRAPRPSPSTRLAVNQASVTIASAGRGARPRSPGSRGRRAGPVARAHTRRSPGRRPRASGRAARAAGARARGRRLRLAPRRERPRAAPSRSTASVDRDLEPAARAARRAPPRGRPPRRRAPRALPYVCERARPHDLAALDDHDRVADPLDLLEVVRRDDDVQPELGPDAADEVEHGRPLERVEPVGRLVEEDELGIVRDRGGELHALALAGRHRPHRPEALLAEADEPERLVRALHRRAAGQQVHLGEVADEVARRELGRELVVLGRVADAGAHLDARCRGVAPEDRQLAGVARAEPEHERHERRLARAVRPEQARDPGPDVRGQPGERDGAAEALDDVARGDDALGRARLGGRMDTAGRRGSRRVPRRIVAATPARRAEASGRPACRGPVPEGRSPSEGIRLHPNAPCETRL